MGNNYKYSKKREKEMLDIGYTEKEILDEKEKYRLTIKQSRRKFGYTSLSRPENPQYKKNKENFDE